MFYGTLISEVERLTNEGKAIVFDIDVKGALNIKKYADQALAFFVKPPSIQTLTDRLKKRNSESDETMTNRLERVNYEMSYEDKSLLTITLEKAVLEAVKIIGKFLEQP